MTAMDSNESSRLTRRTLLAASAGAIAVSAGAGRGTATGPARTDAVGRFGRCPDATLRPSVGHCEGASTDGCADDQPETQALRDSVRDALESHYPTVGELIDDGFLPYFDTLDREEGGYSHWLSPAYIADDGLLDPERPESVLVDNDRWVPIGVMFVATRGGEPVDPPPAVYETDEGGRCSPWHYHAGLPGRFAWWYYREVYADERASGQASEDDELAGERADEREAGDEQPNDSQGLPCQTPCGLHVWTVDHPESVYAHDPPPTEYREDAVAAEAGFETDSSPGDDRLGWEALPDDVRPDRLPDEFDWP